MIETVEELGEVVGISAACRVMGMPRSNLYRGRQPKKEAGPRPTPKRAMGAEEKAEVRAILNSERFCDSSPREVYATLLDEGVYHCHWRTMYRILAEHDEVHERRDQRRRPVSVKPELCATGPNQLWSWDITYLKGPRGVHYYLYTIIDVFSRYVVGWMISNREAAELAEKLISETCTKQGIERAQLTLHADRGSAMRAKTVAQLLIDLGVTRSHSRPYTPTDNPYSEAQFRTMKYRPDYPERFEGIGAARSWARDFYNWYNREHHHSSLGLMTPTTVHYGRTEVVYEQRRQVLEMAYAAHPERFVGGQPTPVRPPKEVWINQPESEQRTDLMPGPAASDTEPGAQAESRAPNGGAQRSLDAGKHLAIVEQPLDQADLTRVAVPKLELELCQIR
jgi:putative transposase